MKNIPILTFIARYWLLVLFAGAAVTACLNEALFNQLGALIYVPAVAAVAIVVTLLITHLFFRQTLDQDAHDGTYVREWHALDPRTRVILSVVLRIGIFIGVCLIAASVGK